MTTTIEILPTNTHGNAQRRWGSSQKLPHPVPLAKQKKGMPTEVFPCSLRVTLDVPEPEWSDDTAPRGTLFVTLEHADAPNGPWSELCAFEPVSAPGTNVLDVDNPSRFVRASWFFAGAAFIFGISATAQALTSVAPVATPAEDDPLRRLSDEDLERAVNEARTKVAQLDAQATKAGAEYREVTEKFKVKPTPALAGELACRRQLAENTRDEHRAYYDESYSLERELARRADVKRLVVLRAELDWPPVEEAFSASMATILQEFGVRMRAELEELEGALRGRSAVLGEANELEKTVGYGRAAHQPIEFERARRRICARIAHRRARAFPHTMLSDLVYDIERLALMVAKLGVREEAGERAQVLA